VAGQVKSPQSSVLSRQAEDLAHLLQESSCTVALTGAGISVPSGIPDFRSPGTGVWEKVDPMEVAHIDAFRADPARFWSFYRPRFESLGGVEPNDAHKALAELEARGFLDAVITQNVDRLHRKAGTRRLIEVHGSIDTSSCVECGASWRLEQVDELFDGNGVAICQTCRGHVKPDVVLFGELLPEQAIDEARGLAESCDLMLCVGSSLEVYPVAGLPSVAIGHGARLAIVTKGETPYDADADVRMGGDVVADLGAVLAALA
jgi:NAD-dependent protein deacetylase/lipoamidase